MKLLDEERISVAEPPKDNEMYAVYENIVENELKKLKNANGRSYQILRIKIGRYREERLATHTNSLILNKTIYLPLFQIKEDSLALETWQKAMPGYVVKGFTYALDEEPIVDKEVIKHYKKYGWTFGDALNCRTRAVWDNQMLYISLKQLPAKLASNEPLTVYATIIDYSKKELVKDQAQLIWRLVGTTYWKIIPLKTADNPTHFFATIPTQQKGATIEYYIAAESKSGRKETRSKTAPVGIYQFEIE